jgi:predicted component of type VI protein secretion system
MDCRAALAMTGIKKATTVLAVVALFYDASQAG